MSLCELDYLEIYDLTEKELSKSPIKELKNAVIQFTSELKEVGGYSSFTNNVNYTKKELTVILSDCIYELYEIEKMNE